MTKHDETPDATAGRPPVGPQIKVRLPEDVIALVDELAAASLFGAVTRSAWVRSAVEAAVGGSELAGIKAARAACERVAGTQAELDALQEGDPDAPVVVAHADGLMSQEDPIVVTQGVVHVVDYTQVSVTGGTVYAHDRAKVRASGRAVVTVLDEVELRAGEDARVSAYGDARLVLRDRVVARCKGRVRVEAGDDVDVSVVDECAVAASGSARVDASGSARVRVSGRARVQASGRACVTAVGDATVYVDSSDATVAAYGDVHVDVAPGVTPWVDAAESVRVNSGERVVSRW